MTEHCVATSKPVPWIADLSFFSIQLALLRKKWGDASSSGIIPGKSCGGRQTGVCINCVLMRVMDAVKETIADVLSENSDGGLVLETSAKAIVSSQRSITFINTQLIHQFVRNKNICPLSFCWLVCLFG